jgi:hypothetical protein
MCIENGYILKPNPRMQAKWFCSSSLHFSGAVSPYFKKQSSRADFVSGHAQHLKEELRDFVWAQEKVRLRFESVGI